MKKKREIVFWASTIQGEPVTHEDRLDWQPRLRSPRERGPHPKWWGVRRSRCTFRYLGCRKKTIQNSSFHKVLSFISHKKKEQTKKLSNSLSDTERREEEERRAASWCQMLQGFQRRSNKEGAALFRVLLAIKHLISELMPDVPDAKRYRIAVRDDVYDKRSKKTCRQEISFTYIWKYEFQLETH